MKIERKEQEPFAGKFPAWVGGKVVEVFYDGESQGLYMMVQSPDNYLVNLKNGQWGSASIWGGVDYVIEVKGKFVEE